MKMSQDDDSLPFSNQLEDTGDVSKTEVTHQENVPLDAAAVAYLQSRVAIGKLLSNLQLGFYGTKFDKSHHICHPTCFHSKQRARNLLPSHRLKSSDKTHRKDVYIAKVANFNSTPVACQVSAIEARAKIARNNPNQIQLLGHDTDVVEQTTPNLDNGVTRLGLAKRPELRNMRRKSLIHHHRKLTGTRRNQSKNNSNKGVNYVHRSFESKHHDETIEVNKRNSNKKATQNSQNIVGLSSKTKKLKSTMIESPDQATSPTNPCQHHSRGRTTGESKKYQGIERKRNTSVRFKYTDDDAVLSTTTQREPENHITELPGLEEIDTCVSILLGIANIDCLAPSLRSLLTLIGVVVTKSIFKARRAVQDVRIPTDMYSKEFEVTTKEVDQGKQKIRELHSHVHHLRQEVEQLKSKVEERTMDTSNLGRMNSSLRTKCDGLSQQVLQLRDQLGDEEAAHAELLIQVSELQHEYHKYNQQLFGMAQETKIVEQTIAAETEQLESLLRARSDPNLVTVAQLNETKKMVDAKTKEYEKLLKVRKFKEEAHIQIVQECSALEESCKLKQKQVCDIKRKLHDLRTTCTPRPNWENIRERLSAVVQDETDVTQQMMNVDVPLLDKLHCPELCIPDNDAQCIDPPTSCESVSEFASAPSPLAQSEDDSYADDFESEEEKSENNDEVDNPDTYTTITSEIPARNQRLSTVTSPKHEGVQVSKIKDVNQSFVVERQTNTSTTTLSIDKESTSKFPTLSTGKSYQTSFEHNDCPAADAIDACEEAKSTVDQVHGLANVMVQYKLSGVGRVEIERLEHLLDTHHDNVFRLLEQERLLQAKFPANQLVLRYGDPYNNKQAIAYPVHVSESRGEYVRIPSHDSVLLPSMFMLDGVVELQVLGIQEAYSFLEEFWHSWVAKQENVLRRAITEEASCFGQISNEPSVPSLKDMSLVHLLDTLKQVPPHADVVPLFGQFLKTKFGMQRMVAKYAYNWFYTMECFRKVDVTFDLLYCILTKFVPEGTFRSCLEVEHRLGYFLRKISEQENLESSDVFLKSDLYKALRAFFPLKTKFEISKLIEAVDAEFGRKPKYLKISQLLSCMADDTGKSNSVHASQQQYQSIGQRSERESRQRGSVGLRGGREGNKFLQILRRQFLEEVRYFWFDLRHKLSQIKSPNGNCKLVDLVLVLREANFGIDRTSLERILCTGLELEHETVHSYVTAVQKHIDNPKRNSGATGLRVVSLNSFVANLWKQGVYRVTSIASDAHVSLSGREATRLVFAMSQAGRSSGKRKGHQGTLHAQDSQQLKQGRRYRVVARQRAQKLVKAWEPKPETTNQEE